METFSALLTLCAGNPPFTSGFPAHRPVTHSFDDFDLWFLSFDLRLNKRLSKYLRRRWFKTSSRSLWRHCNVFWCRQQYISTHAGQWKTTLGVMLIATFTDKWATRIRQCTRRYAPRALTDPRGPFVLRSHNARYIMLKSLNLSKTLSKHCFWMNTVDVVKLYFKTYKKRNFGKTYL